MQLPAQTLRYLERAAWPGKPFLPVAALRLYASALNAWERVVHALYRRSAPHPVPSSLHDAALLPVLDFEFHC
jgi:hypothetical protein